MRPENRAKVAELFNQGLKAKGLERGVSAKKAEEIGELFIYDEIGKGFFGGGIDANDVAAKLDEVKGAKELRVYINSPGGSVWDGKAIHALLARFPAKKTVFVDGLAASAASFIAMAGDRIVTSPGATWMIHQAMGGAYGYADDLRSTAEILDLETRNIAGLYEKRTKNALADIEKWMADETWMDAAEAKKRGFTDEIDGDEKPAKNEAAPPVLAAVQDTRERVAAFRASRIDALKSSQDRSRASVGAATGQPVRR